MSLLVDLSEGGALKAPRAACEHLVLEVRTHPRHSHEETADERGRYV